jgi:nucleoside-diphosphate-sugar epimerase
MIYILGGNGFVGSGYVRLFQKLGQQYIIITRNNYNQLKNTSCDIFINANGNSSKILAHNEPMIDFEANVNITRSSLEDFKFGFYIHISSCDVYENCSNPELTKEDNYIKHNKQSNYGFHKLISEYCVQHKAINWLILRQGGFVGPGLKKNPIFDIFQGEKLWLDPQSELQFMHTDDSAAIVWDLYLQGLNHEIFNLCGKGSVKLSKILEITNKRVPVEPNSPIVHYKVNIDKVLLQHNIPNTYETVKLFTKLF